MSPRHSIDRCCSFSEHPGWFSLLSVSRKKLVEIVAPPDPVQWVVRLMGEIPVEQHLFQLQSLQYLFNKKTHGYLNYLGSDELRGHGHAPQNGVAAEREPSAAFELRQVTEEQILESQKHAEAAKLEQADQVSACLAIHLSRSLT
jgi:hypothetical protein